RLSKGPDGETSVVSEVMSDVLVLIGPGLAADEPLLGEIAEREFVSLGVRGVITRVRDPADVRSRARRRHQGPGGDPGERPNADGHAVVIDRKSTRLNSSHVKISYAVFCLK